jgi:hypothetical protein
MNHKLLWDQARRFNDYCIDCQDWYEQYDGDWDQWSLEKREFKEEDFESRLRGLPDAADERVLLGRIEKIAIEIVQQRLAENLNYNQRFKDDIDWPVLAKLLAMARLKELTQVRIVKRGGRGKGLRYDATELARTYFGKRIFKSLDLGRRRVLEADELERVRGACAKLKLNLPEEIEPTTTELYFAEEPAP